VLTTELWSLEPINLDAYGRPRLGPGINISHILYIPFLFHTVYPLLFDLENTPAMQEFMVLQGVIHAKYQQLLPCTSIKYLMVNVQVLTRNSSIIVITELCSTNLPNYTTLAQRDYCQSNSIILAYIIML